MCSSDLNYLTMGTARTVPVSTFSGKTLYYLGISGDNGMRDNCFAFYHDNNKVNVTESRCIISSKLIILCFVKTNGSSNYGITWCKYPACNGHNMHKVKNKAITNGKAFMAANKFNALRGR